MMPHTSNTNIEEKTPTSDMMNALFIKDIANILSGGAADELEEGDLVGWEGVRWILAREKRGIAYIMSCAILLARHGEILAYSWGC
jgi:hypothetical protein